MPWCPNCKLEYVDGIKVCPDCKSVLVDSLEDLSVAAESDPYNLDELISRRKDAEYDESVEEEVDSVLPYLDELPSAEERQEMMERIKYVHDNPNYKSKEEKYSENKSGAVVLLTVGILGVAVLILCAVGVIKLPMAVFSLKLVYVVMGCLFFVFIVMGLRSLLLLKKYKFEVDIEKENEEKVCSYVKELFASGSFKKPAEDNFESDYLLLCEDIVNNVNKNMPDLEPGFAFYVVNRFADDLFSENTVNED